MSNNNPTIGLFGTCSDSKWRDMFIEKYKNRNISYFNPVKKDWTTADAANEAKHLASDDIIIIPVLNTSFGFSSLSEIGFAAIRAINENKVLIVLIDDEVDPDLKNQEFVTLSNHTRAIIKNHVKELTKEYPQIILSHSLHDALDISVEIAVSPNSFEDINVNDSQLLIETSEYIRKSEQKLDKNLQTDPEKEKRLTEQNCKNCFYNQFFGGSAITNVNCNNCSKQMTFGSTDVNFFCKECAVKLNACIHCGKDLN